MSTTPAFCAVILLAGFSRQSAFCAGLAGPQKSTIRSDSTMLELFLGPPPGDGAVKVHTAFQLLDIHGIDEVKETFEFTGVLMLKWMDKRRVFDPAEAGVQSKVYQGAFQVNELSPAWYPQVVLANAPALITGRHHHVAGFGVVGEITTGSPGYDSIILKANGTIGTILKENGYATSWFGKEHNTPSYQATAAGPFDQWPERTRWNMALRSY